MELIIGHINAQRSQAAAANLELIIKERKLDILCVQEPYVYRNMVRGYSSPNLKLIQPLGGYPWVAAIINSNNIEVLSLPGNDVFPNSYSILGILCYKRLLPVFQAAGNVFGSNQSLATEA